MVGPAAASFTGNQSMRRNWSGGVGFFVDLGLHCIGRLFACWESGSSFKGIIGVNGDHAVLLSSVHSQACARALGVGRGGLGGN